MNEINIRGRRAATAAVAGLTLTNMLLYGVYDVWADGAVSIGVGTQQATEATTPDDGQDGPLDLRTLDADNGYSIPAYNIVSVRIAQDGDVIGFIGAAANVYWHKVD